jgi:inorganic pyrophosphatase
LYWAASANISHIWNLFVFCTYAVSGYLGMKVAVYSNVRTTVSAQKSGWKNCFNTAFRAGAVMGFALCK